MLTHPAKARMGLGVTLLRHTVNREMKRVPCS